MLGGSLVEACLATKVWVVSPVLLSCLKFRLREEDLYMWHRIFLLSNFWKFWSFSSTYFSRIKVPYKTNVRQTVFPNINALNWCRILSIIRVCKSMDLSGSQFMTYYALPHPAALLNVSYILIYDFFVNPNFLVLFEILLDIVFIISLLTLHRKRFLFSFAKIWFSSKKLSRPESDFLRMHLRPRKS